jgi:hypothetical protein
MARDDKTGEAGKSVSLSSMMGSVDPSKTTGKALMELLSNCGVYEVSALLASWRW